MLATNAHSIFFKFLESAVLPSNLRSSCSCSVAPMAANTWRVTRIVSPYSSSVSPVSAHVSQLQCRSSTPLHRRSVLPRRLCSTSTTSGATRGRSSSSRGRSTRASSSRVPVTGERQPPLGLTARGGGCNSGAVPARSPSQRVEGQMSTGMGNNRCVDDDEGWKIKEVSVVCHMSCSS